MSNNILSLTAVYVIYIRVRFQIQGRINHCADCTMGGGPRCQGAPDQLPIFCHSVLMFERLKRSDD